MIGQSIQGSYNPSREIRKSDPVFSLVVNIGLHLSLVVYTGAMGTILPGKASLLMIACGLFVTMLVFTKQHMFVLAKRCWPLFVMAFLAFISSAWSPDPSLTIRQSTQLFFNMLVGIALVGHNGVAGAIRHLLTNMAIICLLSVVWAIFFPLEGIHQSFESFQSVHAGLWRGVLAHKVSLGTFAGMTFGMLVFFGWRALPHPLLYAFALGVSFLCMLGSGSATGAVTAIFAAGSAYSAYWLVNTPVELRKKTLRIIALIFLSFMVVLYSGLINHLASLLGRTADLTGRTDYWPHILAVVNSGSFLIGYGYDAGFRSLSGIFEAASGIKTFEAHNGLIDMIVAFGYVGAALVTYIYLRILAQAVRLLTSVKPKIMTVSIFPFIGIVTTLVISYAESVVLNSVGIFTIILSVSVAVTVQINRHSKDGAIQV